MNSSSEDISENSENSNFGGWRFVFLDGTDLSLMKDSHSLSEAQVYFILFVIFVLFLLFLF